MLGVGEINAEGRIVAAIAFDPDDIDAAVAELDARYLAGEAAPYAHTWSVIVRFNDAFNRQEIPATDWVTIDHRRLVTADTSDLPALIREVWGLTPDLNIQIEAVHRLSSLGAVVTRELHGTSQEGFAAEWRMIQLLTVEGDRINRSELFDETDLDVALARFDELDRPVSLGLQAFDASADDTNSVVQPVFSALPEFHLVGRDAVAAPVRRHRDCSESAKRAVTSASWSTSAARESITRDWCDAHAPSCEPRGRFDQ